jgi:predicted DNA-binding transcriptional regulator YafY
MPDAVVKAVAATGVPGEEAGWVRAVIPIESVEHALGELLRLGTDVEVLAPSGLRDRITETVRELAGRYLPGSQEALSNHR